MILDFLIDAWQYEVTLEIISFCCSIRLESPKALRRLDLVYDTTDFRKISNKKS
jgi:hypothetical protein